MKNIIAKNHQIKFVRTLILIVMFNLILFFGTYPLTAQDWQPGIIEYPELNNIDYEESYSTTPLPDAPVSMSERLINRQFNDQNRYSARSDSSTVKTQLPTRYRVSNSSSSSSSNSNFNSGTNRVVHAAYNNTQSSNPIVYQSYDNDNEDNNKYTKDTLSAPLKLNTRKTSTAAMTAAAKPQTLPKHISRDFNSDFNVDKALADYNDLPIDDNIIVRRPLQNNTIQASGISGNNINNYNDCNTNEIIDGNSTLYTESCGSCSEQFFDNGYCSPMLMKPFGCGIFDNLTIFGGTTGFKAGQLDNPFGDNFGFTEGINWSAPVSVQNCMISTQLGFRVVHSNINGNFARRIDLAEKDHRTQYFITAGLFKRSLTNPLQVGVAFDHFEDNLYGKVKLTQLRVELSVRTFSNLEYGFIGGFGLEDGNNTNIDLRENILRYGFNTANYRTYKIQAQRYYTLFARKNFAAGNVAEFRIGASEHGNVMIAANGEFPITDRISLNGSLATMIPGGKSGWNRETWDLSAGIVIYFRGGAMTKFCNENRPMFDVAQNGSFLTRIIQK
ncbi:MAG: hypothetical protein LBE18_10160 [Planctomycetaceae bacterium]|jgi:hypothetical protein|nr:hypothetical protein [Planctomycetaceae bacterium]